MSKQPASKEYIIRHGQTEIQLITQHNKNNSILALLRTLAYEIKRNKPELWHEYLKRLNQADQLSNTKKPEEVEDSDTLIQQLMARPH